MMEMRRVVVELSGGADSALTLVRVLKHVKKSDVTMVFVDYGQRYGGMEHMAGKTLAKRLVGDRVLDYRAFRVSGGGFNELETGSGVEVPLRNLMIGSIAASVALQVGADTLVVGSKSLEYDMGDPYSFRDSTRLFYQQLEHMLLIASGRVVHVRPLLMEDRQQKMEKDEVYSELLHAGVFMSETFSCYRPVLDRETRLWRECGGHCHNCETKRVLAATWDVPSDQVWWQGDLAGSRGVA